MVNPIQDKPLLLIIHANKIPEQIEEYKIKKSEVEHKMSIYKEKALQKN